MKHGLSFSQKSNIIISNVIRDFAEIIIWKLTEIKNFFSNKRPHRIQQIEDNILICGNGPSASKLDLQSYIGLGYDVMCVNYYAIKSNMFDLIHPKYYCCVDPAFYTSSHNPEEALEIEKLYNKLNEVTWEMIFVCIEGQYPPINNKNIKIVKLNINRYSTNRPTLKKRMLKRFAKNRATYGYDNVLLACLYYCITAKAKNIALTGFETNTHKEYVVNEKNEVFRDMNHFYGNQTISVDEFSPYGSSQMMIMFYTIYSVFLGCNILDNYAKFQKVQIKNLTSDSFLDMYKKEKPLNRV